MLGEVKGCPVCILDISDWGLKFSAEKPLGTVNKPLTIKIQGPSNLFESIQITGIISWQQEKENLFIYGLQLDLTEEKNEKIQKIKELYTFLNRIRQNLLS